MDELTKSLSILTSTIQGLSAKVDSLLPLTSEVPAISKNIDSINEVLKKKDERITALEEENRSLKGKVLDLEARSRRMNIKFFNFKEENRETNHSIEEKIIIACKSAKITCVTSQSIEVAHRLGKFSANMKFPRPIIVRFSSYKTRQEVWDKFK